MAKPALGKGLGQLMNGQAVARGKPAAGESAATVTPVDFGRGLGTLVAARPAEQPAPEKARVLLPAWFFFAADVLLLAFTVAVCFQAEGPLAPGELIFASVSTTLGALLAILGVLRSQPAG